MAVSDYKTNPDENTTISGINIAEGCPPSGINNAIRQLMADVKQNSDEQSSEFSKVMTGATESAAGTSGNVPAPKAGEQNKAFFGDGKYYNVVRSVGGSTPDANGNVNAPYLPKAGGNVTGAIKLYVGDDYIGNIVATDDTISGKSILIDTWEQGDMGAYLSLRKGSDTTTNPGGFFLVARNTEGTIVKLLEGHIDGDLRWDGKRIVRSVNGVLADSTGNVRTTDDMWVGDNSGGFTMPWDGLVIGRFGGGNAQEFRIYRNGNEIFYARQADQGYGSLSFPFCIAAYAGEWVSAANNAWYGVRAVRK